MIIIYFRGFKFRSASATVSLSNGSFSSSFLTLSSLFLPFIINCAGVLKPCDDGDLTDGNLTDADLANADLLNANFFNGYVIGTISSTPSLFFLLGKLGYVGKSLSSSFLLNRL